jgi:hypothetical protein
VAAAVAVVVASRAEVSTTAATGAACTEEAAAAVKGVAACRLLPDARTGVQREARAGARAVEAAASLRRSHRVDSKMEVEGSRSRASLLQFEAGGLG